MRQKGRWWTVLAALLGVALLLPMPATAQPSGSNAAPDQAPQQPAAVATAPHADSDKAVALRDDDFLSERWVTQHDAPHSLAGWMSHASV